MAQQVKHLACMSADPNSEPQDPCEKLGVVVCIYNSSPMRCSQDNPQGSLPDFPG